jgi:hypothetical protein
MHPSARIPLTNMSAYIRSTPKDPIATVVAQKFSTPVPAMSQPADMTTEQFKAEARSVIKAVDMHFARLCELEDIFRKRWREFGPTQDLACSAAFGCSLRAMRDKRNYWKSKLESQEVPVDLTPEQDKKNNSNQIDALPDPLAELEAQMAKPAVHAGPLPDQQAKPKAAPKPVPEHQPRERNDNGKPIYALPVWKDLVDFYGHALNRLSDANRAVPDQKLYEAMQAETKDLMNKSRMWREKSRKP